MLIPSLGYRPMTKSTRLLFVMTLFFGLAAGMSWAAKGGNGGGGGGKGGDGQGNPDRLNVIVEFDPNPSQLIPDTPIFSDANIGDGFVELPGSGNLVIQLGGGRSVTVDLSRPLGDPPMADGTSEGAAVVEAYADFLQAFGTGVDGEAQYSPSFITLNRLCLVKDLQEDSITGDYFCGNLDATAGSLKAMKYQSNGHDHADGNSTDFVLRFYHGNMPNPFGDGWFETNCELESKSLFIAHCSAQISSTDDTCAEWRIVPFDEPFVPGSVDLGAVQDSTNNSCLLTHQESYRRSFIVRALREYSLRFGLTVNRDENGDGVADPSYVPVAP